MKTTPFRIYTKDNLELFGLLYEPETATKKVLVHVHGMAGNFYENKFLDFIAQTLTANGIAFLSFNNRGCEFIKDLYKVENGKRSIVRYGDAFEIFDDCVLDIAAAIDFAESKGFTEVHLSGHSLGSPKAAYYLTQVSDSRVSSVLFLSPTDMVGLAKADQNYKRDLETATKMIAEGNGAEILPFLVFGECYLSAKSYMSLHHESSNVSVFNLHNLESKLEVLSKIKIPTITVVGKADSVLVVPIDAFIKRITLALVSSPKVESKVLGDADHGYDGYEQQLADTIKDWILK